MHDELRFSRQSRRHRMGKAHVLHVIANTEPHYVAATGGLVPRLMWVGSDDRGVELEIVAVVLPGELIVIHVTPTTLGRTP